MLVTFIYVNIRNRFQLNLDHDITFAEMKKQIQEIVKKIHI
jgi:hypothetical protein